MYINHRLQAAYPFSEQQQGIIQHEQGPLLIIAGPGSGKTSTLIARALNLLLEKSLSEEPVNPSQLILCTYTDKAAHEMRSRMLALAEKVDYHGDLSQLRVGTIHALCNSLITQYRHNTKLLTDYKTLDEFEQRLFIFRHLAQIVVSPASLNFFQERWGDAWYVAQKLQLYFNKIMEELIDKKRLRSSTDPLIHQIADAYNAYGKLLVQENRLSFSAQLKIAYDLLHQPGIGDKIVQGIQYVFVDEYQDTNYIQGQIIRRLASATGNLCVVGDEDQSLYRFRGATVRNILEFDKNVPDCTIRQLTTNYRSHPTIIEAYDQWMSAEDWSEGGELRFRHNKTITPRDDVVHLAYPAALALQGKTKGDEAEQFVDFIVFLKCQGRITDYNQVALLLYSVKPLYSNQYLEALQQRGIPYFCPRARAYFEQEEVCLVVGCIALLLGFDDTMADDIQLREDFAEYVRKQCIQALHTYCPSAHPLHVQLAEWRAAVMSEELPEQQAAQNGLMDYFYRLLAVEPFATFVNEEKQMRNLVRFSKLLKSFQEHYRYTHLDYTTVAVVRADFLSIFLRLHLAEGINEFEDAEQPFPSGHVQVMTIHQAKGLEFPVVVVGSLHQSFSGAQKVEKDLRPYCQRDTEFEPEKRIPRFDAMRLYYVGFSRAEHILVLTSNLEQPPKPYFESILSKLPRWPDVKDDFYQKLSPRPKEPLLLKRSYSFTGDFQSYETCPRKYQFFREYQFVPARQREVLLGQLVHQALEWMHKYTLGCKSDSKLERLNEHLIRERLERIYVALTRSYPEQVEESLQEQAFTQVNNYFTQNRRELQQILDAEIDITLQREGYVLTGRIDLLRDNNGSLELVDFKTDEKAQPGSLRLIDYERQLCTYAQAIEQRYGQLPDRLLLYWTRERLRSDALMEIHYHPETAARVENAFATIVSRIQDKDFRVLTVPEAGICQRCDLNAYCTSDGTIAPCEKEAQLLLR